MSNPPPPPAGLSPMQQAILDIRTLRARVQASEGRLSAPIAVTGMSCRFPGGADTPAAFWRLLEDEVDAVVEVPPERWDLAQWFDPDPDAPAKMSTRRAGFLENIDQFDAEFFGISDREAVSIDPQQRLLLETGWSALENAGLPAASIFGSKIGVFIGISSFDYAGLRGQTGDITQMDAYHATGISHSAAAGRLAYYFGLRGPALSIDTACSSSLVALHLACQSLRLGECDASLAGGVNLILSPELHVALSKAHMLAPDGRCKAFDAAADGFVRSEGCGMLVLRRLDDALRDGDRIHAVIRGSACNQDGRSSGLSAPNGPSQTTVIQAAWLAAGLKAEDIDYVEAHGTGTALGDPIEAGALTAAFKDAPEGRVLAIGSVKTNLGHMEAAAGVGGVIKTILALAHERVPASLHFKQGSPNIDWGASRLKVVSQTVPWPRSSKPRRAGISSFGFSGTNAHLVLEEPPLAPQPDAPASDIRIVTVSATNEQGLSRVAEDLRRTLQDRLADPEAWADFTYAANARRSHFPVRAALVAPSAEAAVASLGDLARGEPEAAILRGRADAMRPPAIAFLAGDASGLSLDQAYASELHATSAQFREAVDACAQVAKADPAVSAPRAAADSAAFAIQWALAQTWRIWSGEPVAATGEGVGAYVAACLAGALSIEDALALVIQRSACIEEKRSGSATAAMAAFRDALERTSFPAPHLQPHASVKIDREYWLAELASARAGAPIRLDLGDASAAVVLNLTPDPNGVDGHEQTTMQTAGRLACAQGSSLRTSMLQALAAFYVRGGVVDWRSVEGKRPGRAADLPGYPWSRRTYWFPKRPLGSQEAELWSDMVAATGRQADQVPIDLHLHTYHAKYRALSRLSSAYIVRTLSDLGALSEPTPVLSADVLVNRLGVQPLYRELMQIWLDKLAREGRLREEDGHFSWIEPKTAEPIEAYESDAAPLFVDAPILLEYVKGCGTLLTKVIKGDVSPLETLFPNGDRDLAEGLYHRAALSRYFNAIAGAAAQAFAACRPGRLKVLEVGGGTGGITGSILAGLPAERSHYTFSDVSSFFFEPAAERFKAFGFLDFAVLDLEQAPETQGFELGAYDLIVAANVLHATTDLGQTLDFVRSLLSQGGALLLYEVTHPPAYFDVSIALIEGWQKSSDSIRGVGPLLTTEAWKNLLPEHGFDFVQAWPDPASAAEVLGSHVFMALAAGGAAVTTAAPTTRQEKATFSPSTAQRSQEDDIRDQLTATPPSEHRHLLIEFVRRRVGAVLKRPGDSEIPADRRLMDLGLDSLMALELRNALTKSLRLEPGLPATLIFDHPSIGDIADLLLTRLGEQAVAKAPPERIEPSSARAESRLTEAQLGELSDADVERLLNERLGDFSPTGVGDDL